jgi:hypothetical protein
MYLAEDANSKLYAKQLSMTSGGVFTWLGVDNNATLAVATGTAGDYAFSYWRFIPVAAATGVITVAATGTQVATLSVSSTNQYIGGAFTLTRDTGSANVTQIKLTETGTVNADANLSTVQFYYETAAACATSSIPGTATIFNSTGVPFSSSQATATGTMAVGTSQVCLYTELNISPNAGAGDTIDIEITNPSTDLTVSTGTVSPATVQAISGSTVLGTAGSLLSVSSTDVTKNPTQFYLSNGTIWMKEGSSTAIALTSSAVTASNLVFTNLTKPGTKGTVRIQFTLTSYNPGGSSDYNFTKTFEATAGVRTP